MPELAVKIRIAPSSSNTMMSGMSHHFFLPGELGKFFKE
jgi:hypothetical protein